MDLRTILLAFILLAPPANAWDFRAHGLAANVGAKLMKDRAWSRYLQCQSDLVSDAAGYPDTVFRPQSTALAGFEAEAPTHYFHIDNVKIAGSLSQVRSMSCPDAVQYLSKNFAPDTMKPLPGDAPDALKRARESTVGSSPWRAEQFANDAHRSVLAGNPVDAAYYLGVGAHYIADHAVPWHAITDAHGENGGLPLAEEDGKQSGHANIHIFLEHCMDSFLNPTDPRYPDLVAQVEKQAREKLKDLLARTRNEKGIPSIAISALEESEPKGKAILALDDASTFVSGKLPALSTSKDAEAAKRQPAACEKFRGVLTERLAAAAAFVSIYFDRALPKDRKPPANCEKVTGSALTAFKTRDYPWLACGESAP